MIITCSRCEDEVEISNRTIVSPFVCAECKPFDGIQKAVAPAPEDFSVTPLDVSDSATVENTTLLIEDLEKQIVDLKQQVSDDTKFLNDFQRQTKYLTDLTIKLGLETFGQSLQIAKLVGEVTEAQEAETKSYATLGLKMREFERNLEGEQQNSDRRLLKLKSENVKLEQSIAAMESRLQYGATRFKKLTNKNFQLREERSALRVKFKQLRNSLYDLQNLWLVKAAIWLHNYFGFGEKYIPVGFVSLVPPVILQGQDARPEETSTMYVQTVGRAPRRVPTGYAG